MDIYGFELRHRKSGDSTLNAENRAYAAFQNTNKNKPLQLMHCLEIMRTFPKLNPEIFQLPSESEVTKMHALIHHTRKGSVLHHLDLMG